MCSEAQGEGSGEMMLAPVRKELREMEGVSVSLSLCVCLSLSLRLPTHPPTTGFSFAERQPGAGSADSFISDCLSLPGHLPRELPASQLSLTKSRQQWSQQHVCPAPEPLQQCLSTWGPPSGFLGVPLEFPDPSSWPPSPQCTLPRHTGVSAHPGFELGWGV